MSMPELQEEHLVRILIHAYLPLYYAILYNTILDSTLLYYTIPYYTILYYTMPNCTCRSLRLRNRPLIRDFSLGHVLGWGNIEGGNIYIYTHIYISCIILYILPIIRRPLPGRRPEAPFMYAHRSALRGRCRFCRTIGPRLPHPFYSGISPPPPGTRRSHSAVLGTTSRPRLLDPFHLSGISIVELLGTPRHSSALLGTTNRPRLLHPVYFSGIAMVVE